MIDWCKVMMDNGEEMADGTEGMAVLDEETIDYPVAIVV
jgi:hypothetical protein